MIVCRLLSLKTFVVMIPTRFECRCVLLKIYKHSNPNNINKYKQQLPHILQWQRWPFWCGSAKLYNSFTPYNAITWVAIICSWTWSCRCFVYLFIDKYRKLKINSSCGLKNNYVNFYVTLYCTFFNCCWKINNTLLLEN